MAHDWFDDPAKPSRRRGLRFGCTMCGRCCSGPPGFVLVSPEEIRAIASFLGMDDQEFTETRTHPVSGGVSLRETLTPLGWDCEFLDRTSVPGRAVCSIYEARPAQCRAWPFWKHNLSTPEAWEKAGVRCPGIGQGSLHAPEVIRMTRDGSPL